MQIDDEYDDHGEEEEEEEDDDREEGIDEEEDRKVEGSGWKDDEMEQLEKEYRDLHHQEL